MSEFIVKIIEVLVGFTVGYLTFRLSAQKDALAVTLSVTIGLLTSLLATNLIESYRQNTRYLRLQELLNKLLEKLSDRYVNASDTAQLLQFGSTAFTREKTMSVWLDLLWLTSSRYWATNYTKEVWDSSLPDLGIQIQIAKARAKQVDMRRVYIIDDLAELNGLRERIEAQLAGGIKVKYVLVTEIKKNKYFNSLLKELDSLDMALIDSRIIFSLELDKQRRIQNSKTIFDEKMCKNHERIFEMIFDEAKAPQFDKQ
jgi:hypothetical protein